MSLGAGVSGQNNWGTLTRQVQPYLYPTEDQLVQTISQMMLGGNNPALKQMQTAATDSVNNSYAAMPRTVTSQLSGLGFGKSGKLGSALYNLQGKRLSDLSGLNSQFDQIGLNQQNLGASLAEQLLNSTMGASTFGGQQGAGANVGV